MVDKSTQNSVLYEISQLAIAQHSSYTIFCDSKKEFMRWLLVTERYA